MKPSHNNNGHGPNGQRHQGSNGRSFPTNWGIPGETVRILDNGGSRICQKKLGIEEAQGRGEDLIEIARPENGPPVCRIADVGKLRYELEKAHKKEKSHRTKEIGLHTNIAEHDLQTKLRHAKEFLEDEDRVVFRLQFRGRERAHKDLGTALLDRICKELDAHARFDAPNSAGANIFLRGSPKKREGGSQKSQYPNQKNHGEQVVRDLHPAHPESKNEAQQGIPSAQT